MQQLKTIPWFLLLLVVFFVVHGTAENFEFLYFSEVMKIGAAILVAVALFFLLIRFFIKDKVHAALICFFISAWVLFFGAAFDWVRSIRLLHFIHSFTIFIPLMLCTWIIFILFIRRKKIVQDKLCFYLNVLLLIYCLYDIAVISFKAVRNNKSIAISTVNFDTSLVKTKPNVYLLLFDEYPGYTSLKDSFAFANNNLYGFLNNKSFKFLPTFSNYNMTFYSMASMLNMRYVEKNYDPSQNTVEDEQRRLLEIKNAQAVQCFKSMGYTFVNYSIFDILDKPGVKGNSFVISQATLLTDKILFNKLLKGIGWHFITGKHKISFIENIYMKDKRNNEFMEDELMKMKPSNSAAPKFVYAHFNMPHFPFFYDSLGKPLSNAQIFNEALYSDRPLFLSYLKYANTKIVSLVNSICSNDSTAIVIVMSDHGFRNYHNNGAFTPAYFDNFCALRFPDQHYLPTKDKISNVNFFPYLFNSQFNQQIPYLADSSIFLKDKKLAE